MINHTISCHDDVTCRYVHEYYRVVSINRKVSHSKQALSYN